MKKIEDMLKNLIGLIDFFTDYICDPNVDQFNLGQLISKLEDSKSSLLKGYFLARVVLKMKEDDKKEEGEK